MLLTGAAGRIGREILPTLDARFDLKATDQSDGRFAGVDVTALDICDAAAVREAVAGCDVVCHLAIANRSNLQASGMTDDDELDRAEIDVNVWGTRNVFAAAAGAKVSRVVFMSSLTVHMGRDLMEPVGEESPVKPLNHYAVTKLYGEHLAQLHSRKSEFSAVCLRLGQPYPVEHYNETHIRQDGWRTLGITFGDIARGIITAATADLTDGFAVAPLLSDTDEQVYDMTPMKALGYRSADRFGPDGVTPTGADE